MKADNGLIETRMDRDKNDRKRMAVVTEGGREAITGYEVLERFGRFTVVRCSLKTGRTHQIRLHMEYLGYPLVGDPKYSPMKTPFSIKGQALHSQAENHDPSAQRAVLTGRCVWPWSSHTLIESASL